LAIQLQRDGTEGRSQFATYCRAVATHVARVDAAPRRAGSFRCQIATQRVGPLQLVAIDSDELTLQRSSRCIAVDPSTHYIIALHRSGSGVIRHARANVPLEPGTIALLDKAMPYEAQFLEPSVRLLVCMSRLHLEQRVPDPERCLHNSVRADRGVGRIAADYLVSLFEEAAHLDASNQQTAAAVCLDLLASALLASPYGDPAPAPLEHSRGANSQVLLSRIRAYVRSNLSSPELCPEVIATAHGISKRYLHTLFASTGSSLGAWIREQRLGRAYADLSSPRTRELSITEIALCHGFNDIPHFGRCFKARYGVTPKTVRPPGRG
jgi:AraC-like DNA-binding protein